MKRGRWIFDNHETILASCWSQLEKNRSYRVRYPSYPCVLNLLDLMFGAVECCVGWLFGWDGSSGVQLEPVGTRAGGALSGWHRSCTSACWQSPRVSLCPCTALPLLLGPSPTLGPSSTLRRFRLCKVAQGSVSTPIQVLCDVLFSGNGGGSGNRLQFSCRSGKQGRRNWRNNDIKNFFCYYKRANCIPSMYIHFILASQINTCRKALQRSQ